MTTDLAPCLTAPTLPGEAPAPTEAPASYYSISHGNDQFWRVLAPAKALGAKVFLLPEEAQPKRDERGRFAGREPSVAYSLQRPNDDSMFPWTFLVNRNDPSDIEVHFPENEGTAVWSRPDPARMVLARAMREKCGIRTLAEVDDNYIGKPSNNVFMRSNGYSRDDRMMHLMAMSYMSGIVFSTRRLRDLYHRAYRKEVFLRGEDMPEFFVCGNHVAADDWPERNERTDRLRVGWMGSPSHLWDVELITDAMARAQKIGCEPVVIGFNPAEPWTTIHGGDPRQWLNKKPLKQIRLWQAIDFTHIGWVAPQKFRRFSLPLDVGLCPLRRNDFTLGKSDVKAVEYTIAGAAVIVQGDTVYGQWRHGETCLVARSRAEFARHVETLARDENLRERLVANAQQYVREYRGEKQLREEWGAAIGC